MRIPAGLSFLCAVFSPIVWPEENHPHHKAVARKRSVEPSYIGELVILNGKEVTMDCASAQTIQSEGPACATHVHEDAEAVRTLISDPCNEEREERTSPRGRSP